MGEEGNERMKKMRVGLCGIRVVRGIRKKEKMGNPQRKKKGGRLFPKKNGGRSRIMERERGEKKMRLAVERGE